MNFYEFLEFVAQWSGKADNMEALATEKTRNVAASVSYWLLGFCSFVTMLAADQVVQIKCMYQALSQNPQSQGRVPARKPCEKHDVACMWPLV